MLRGNDIASRARYFQRKTHFICIKATVLIYDLISFVTRQFSGGRHLLARFRKGAFDTITKKLRSTRITSQISAKSTTLIYVTYFQQWKPHSKIYLGDGSWTNTSQWFCRYVLYALIIFTTKFLEGEPCFLLQLFSVGYICRRKLPSKCTNKDFCILFLLLLLVFR